jgi:hypothetical protein
MIGAAITPQGTLEFTESLDFLRQQGAPTAALFTSGAFGYDDVMNIIWYIIWYIICLVSLVI